MVIATSRNVLYRKIVGASIVSQGGAVMGCMCVCERERASERERVCVCVTVMRGEWVVITVGRVGSHYCWESG